MLQTALRYQLEFFTILLLSFTVGPATPKCRTPAPLFHDLYRCRSVRHPATEHTGPWDGLPSSVDDRCRKTPMALRRSAVDVSESSALRRRSSPQFRFAMVLGLTTGFRKYWRAHDSGVQKQLWRRLHATNNTSGQVLQALRYYLKAHPYKFFNIPDSSIRKRLLSP